MIGRGVMGNPWIFEEIVNYLEEREQREIKNEEKLETIIEHIELEVKEKGEIVAIKEMRKHHFKLMVTSLQTKNSIYDIDFNKKIIVIGNEANGVSKEIQDMADEKAKIPMLGRTESLNASVAAGVVMYEYVRQKLNK